MILPNQIIKPNTVQKNFFRLKYAIRTFLGDHPRLFFHANNLTKGEKWAVNEKTELVIEGFQRSGNTFSVGAFNAAQAYKVNVASHLHVPAQVIYAARNSIPVLVVVRYPVDSILSWKALELESSSKLQHIALDYSLHQLFNYYIRFYTKIMPYQNSFVVASFEEVITDFGGVIDKINQHFNTDFTPFVHTEENTKKVFASQNFHAGTSLSRQEFKAIVQEQYEKELRSAKFKSLVSKSEEVHLQFRQLA
jgi:hypothetical protein